MSRLTKLDAPFDLAKVGDTLKIAVSTPGPPAGSRELRREFPRETNDRLDRALVMNELLESGRVKLGSTRWSQITEVVNEYASSPSALTVSPHGANSGFVTITSFVAVVPGSATGILQLGDWNCYLSPGLSNAQGLNLQLATDDIRILTVTIAGPISLLLCGHVSPMNAQLPL